MTSEGTNKCPCTNLNNTLSKIRWWCLSQQRDRPRHTGHEGNSVYWQILESRFSQLIKQNINREPQ